MTLVAVFMLAMVDGTAQQKPNLSGTWIATTEAPASIGPAPSAILGPRFSLRLTGDTLTIRRAVRDTSSEATFDLGGAEVHVKIPGRTCMADSYFIETAVWEGDAIAVTAVGSIPAGGGPPTKLRVKRLLRLTTPETLLVEGSMTQAGQPRPVGTIYRRSNDAVPSQQPARASRPHPPRSHRSAGSRARGRVLARPLS
jgi:hypothetical protein